MNCVHHFSEHLLDQTEDLLPSAVTLLMAFPKNKNKAQKKKD